ncbi:MAG: signal recognition particle protein [Holosporales bacterium]|jgi:signal recognition particle subunit SRP54|nr:signal recognition particle protein [Holosporales bacterium]
MFSALSKKLTSIINGLKGRGILTEDAVDSTIREIRISLLEADVALSVVKAFTTNLKEKLVGKKIINTITPEQTIIKAVYDELVDLLGSSEPILYDKKGTNVLVVGLQGTGKTTTAAKLANLLKTKFKKNVLLVSLDTYRPAAIDQLRKIANSNSIDFFADVNLETDSPITIASKAINKRLSYDITIYDTAGRLYLDETMMTEVAKIKEIVSPNEIFLVIDSMMGQDAINTARAFNESLSLSGLILTRVDGDARGGAALSAKFITNCPIKYMCTGEKIGDIEQFHADRVASRILDKGDVLGLIENAMDANMIDDVKDIAIGKNFDLNGMEKYLMQLQKIGGVSGFLKFIPGIGKLKEQLNASGMSDKTVNRQIAIIRSMTKDERRDYKVLNSSRRRRIAAGCAQEVADVNRLIKQFEQVKIMMTKLQNPKAIQSFAGKWGKR